MIQQQQQQQSISTELRKYGESFGDNSSTLPTANSSTLLTLVRVGDGGTAAATGLERTPPMVVLLSHTRRSEGRREGLSGLKMPWGFVRPGWPYVVGISSPINSYFPATWNAHSTRHRARSGPRPAPQCTRAPPACPTARA